jgi:hypothetical protein
MEPKERQTPLPSPLAGEGAEQAQGASEAGEGLARAPRKRPLTRLSVSAPLRRFATLSRKGRGLEPAATAIVSSGDNHQSSGSTFTIEAP